MKEYIDYLYGGGSDDLFRLEGETAEEFIKRCDDIEEFLFADVLKEIRESERYKSYVKGHDEWIEEMRNKLREQGGSSDTAIGSKLFI